MKDVVLYGAPDCHLCANARAKIERIGKVVPFRFRYENVRLDDALTERYGDVIPVVTVNGREAAVTKVTEFRLLKALALA